MCPQVRLQSQPDERPLRYRGPLDCFVQGIRQDGLRGMYRGISSPLVGAAAESSCLFFSVCGISYKSFLPYKLTNPKGGGCLKKTVQSCPNIHTTQFLS